MIKQRLKEQKEKKFFDESKKILATWSTVLSRLKRDLTVTFETEGSVKIKWVIVYTHQNKEQDLKDDDQSNMV